MVSIIALFIGIVCVLYTAGRESEGYRVSLFWPFVGFTCLFYYLFSLL